MNIKMKYVALLRGINISGKNKISMIDLKKCMESSGFLNVKTVLNSGNVIFDSNLDINKISENIIELVKKNFNLSIPILIITVEELKDIINNSPIWWDSKNKDTYANLIFAMPNVTANLVCDKLGKPSENIDKILVYKNVIFWSFQLKDYCKSNWWINSASKEIKNDITIRTSRTVKKIIDNAN